MCHSAVRPMWTSSMLQARACKFFAGNSKLWPSLRATSQKHQRSWERHMKLQLMRCRNPLLKDIPSHSSVMGVRCDIWV